MKISSRSPVLATFVAALFLAWHPLSHGQAAPESVLALKKSLVSSRQSIRQYEWVQTVTVTVDGKTTRHDQLHCYYGLDGTLQKVQVGEDGSTEKGIKIMLPPAMLLSKIKEHHAKELKAFADKAEKLVQQYLPTDPEKIQAAVDAGKLSRNPAGQRVTLGLSDYLLPGDSLGAVIESPTNRLISIAVNSYVDTPEDAVQFNAEMGMLPDGTVYASHITLAAPSRDLNIVIDNTGHRPASH